MTSKFGVRWARVALAATAALGLAAVSVPASYAADGAEFYVVQGLPGKSVDVAVDGKTVVKNVETAAVAGPFKIKAGSRKVTFSDGGDVLADQMFTVKAGSNWDVVVHLPASSSDDAVVTVFRNDLDRVPSGKASLVVAHTAAVPPADIRVDGKVLFSNIANGESLKLTVPVGTYQVAIVPTGETKPVILGPIALTVKGGAVNRVYALGDPEKKSMNVAVHILPTGSSGSGKPSKVDTGTGGHATGQGSTLTLPSGEAVKLTR